MNFKRRILCIALLLSVMMSLCACGTDGAEDAQKRNPVIMPKQAYVEPPYVDYHLSKLPEFVDSIDQCTDTGKQYVLPSGYLYGYGKKFVPYATNQLSIATDQDGAVFNSCGYQDGVRIRSVLEIGESDFSFVTGFIPVKTEDVFYFSGNCFQPQYENANVMYTVLYDANKTVIGQTSMTEAVETYFEVLESNEEGYITAIQVRSDWTLRKLAYIRFTLIGSGDQQIISVNESLEAGEDVDAWVPIEPYVSQSWYEEIGATVDTVSNIALEDSSTAIRFVFASDIHVDPDPSASYTEDMGKVCAQIMQTCDVPFFVTGGDNCTQSSGYMPTDFEENMQVLLNQLEPIPQKNILLSVGNHDGATGSREENGEMLYYCYQLSNEQRSAVFFDWQRETNEYKHFGPDGTYYYLDDSATKTRYIVLNSFWNQWEGDADGLVNDLQHSFSHNAHFGPQQLEWFAAKALDMPADYGAVIIVHFAPDAKDFEIFKGIVDAFSTRSTYSGSYVATEDWLSTEISVNYRYADGEIIAVFQGHNHEDALHNYFQKVPCINITTAGAYWAARGDTALERLKGTSSEFAADVVVIDRESRKIYLTRLGAGEDRVVEYGS